MAIDFPNTPTTNQIYTVGSRSWKWDGTIWSIYSNNPVLYRQDSPPSSPQEGDQWFETDTGRMFVYYGTAWVELGNATDVAGALQPSQVTSLSAATTLTSDDVFPIVDNPSSAVASSKITWDNVQSSITSTGTLGSLAVTGDITRGGVSMPRGVMAVGNQPTVQNSISGITEIVSSGTFTAVANRYYRITFTSYNNFKQTTATVQWRIQKTNTSGTVLTLTKRTIGDFTQNGVTVVWVGTLTAGAQNVIGSISADAGVIASEPNASQPSQIIVEDIGAV
jgi:hypothetical protein